MRHRIGVSGGVGTSGDGGSAVDDGHVPFFVALAGGRCEVVQPFDLLGANALAPRSRECARILCQNSVRRER
jgi:hypothetical protein